ncbi:MAG TPA: NTP transferase domain-containing protein [Nitrososphaeraceae archaeon]|jgi:adenosylcobinamide-phosphate guanylyltransferase
MMALIMCGGKGSRLNIINNTEKPLVSIGGVPMIEYVINAVVESRKFMSVLAVTSRYTPTTLLYLKSHKYFRSKIVDTTSTLGVDYSTDLGQLIELLKPSTLFVAPCDIPLLKAHTIHEILRSWEPGTPYSSVILKKEFVERLGIKPSIIIRDRGQEYCYSGISIIDTSKVTVGAIVKETYIISNCKEIAFNINTKEDLAAINAEFN